MRDSECKLPRRSMLRTMGGSLLLPALADLMNEKEARADANPLAPRPPHFLPRAKQVILLFMGGGVSHVDTFDPKPTLIADNGKTVVRPEPMDPSQKVKGDRAPKLLLRPFWKFAPGGKCGTQVSDLLPEIRRCADDLCVIRSMVTSDNTHGNATLGLHTGSFNAPRPSMGSWVSYGLGTFNRNLPSYVVISPDLLTGGNLHWSSDFLPGIHQGTLMVPGDRPVADVDRWLASRKWQELQLGLLGEANKRHLAIRAGDPALAARIQTFETAFGMQREAPEVFDLSRESDQTLALYGLERGLTKGFGWQCLIARRLVERGVRFVELIDSIAAWDTHSNTKDMEKPAANVDRPIAALLEDLKRRGMLDETLVVWTSEFGRTPYGEMGGYREGRNHQATAYSSWLAGGGVKPGIVYGATDECGFEAVENPVHVHDLQATILHLLGVDHTRLTYRHGGRDYRLTDVHGNVVKDILARST